MFRHSTTPSSAPSYGDAFMAASFSSVPTQIPRSAAGGYGGYLDGGNASGAFPPFAAASSPPSYSSSYYNNIHRSISSHSLPLQLHQLGDALNNGGGGGAFFSSSSLSPHQLSSLPPLSSSPSSSCGDLYEFTSSCPVRRVFSTGDLQGMNGSSPVQSGDSCGQDAGGGPFSQKVGRYSAEERKERVERYRLKRHQRNFTKKITYACRKSLADSRPRVKGRFARNGETEAENYDEREASDNSYDYCGYSEPSNLQSTGNSCYHGKDTALVGGGDNGDWWWRAPGATTVEAEGQRQVGFDLVDEEIWATLGDMLSVNLAS
ncbi:hypothetical protein ACQ4PT_020325 [Festuca glaucescens]